jgi:NAD(P)H-dependent FMN reductase
VLHENEHALATHVGCACAIVVEHALPQVLQSLALLVVSTQVPLHSVGSTPGQPETQP